MSEPKMTIEQVRSLAAGLKERMKTAKPPIAPADLKAVFERVKGIRSKYIEKLRTDPETQRRVLADLKAEREKFTQSNKTLMKGLIDDLVEAGVYPPLNPERKLTYAQLVDGWGEDWYVYRGLLNCPHCNYDLRDPKGPPFKLEIGIEIFGLYDGLAYHKCPNCGGCWSRKGTPLTEEQVKSISRDDIFTL